MESIKIKVKLIHPDAKMPFYGSLEAAGFDLYSIEEKTIGPGKTDMIKTGVCVEMPKGHCLKFRDRSSFGAKGIHHFGGLIDPDYRGELKIVLHNSTSQEFRIDKGDRIIQAVPVKIPKAEFELVEELSSTARNDGGFGSSGLR